MTRGGGAVSDLDVGGGRLARFHAVQEILHVRDMLHRSRAASGDAFQFVIETDARQIVERGAERDAAGLAVALHLRRDLVARAIHEQRAARAVKLDAIAAEGAVAGITIVAVRIVMQAGVVQHEAGIFPSDVVCIGRVAPVAHKEFAAGRGHRLRRIDAHGHVDNVHQVDAPIRHASAAVGEKRAPVAQEMRGIERNAGRRAEPEIVIEAGGRIGIGRGAEPFGRFRCVNPGLHVVDFAKLAGAYDLGGALEVGTRPLLQAHLHDAIVAPRGFHHQTSFAHHVGDGLFHVDVFPGLAGGDHDVRMPMIGRGDDHRVHSAVVQQLAEIGIRARLAAGELMGFCKVRLVDVADRYDFGVGLFLEIGQIHAPHAAAADDADGDPIVGGGAGLRRERTGAGQRRGLEEVSPIHGLLSVGEPYSIAALAGLGGGRRPLSYLSHKWARLDGLHLNFFYHFRAGHS